MTIQIQTGYMAYPFTCLYCLPISTLHYYSQYISCKEEFVVIIHKLMFSHLIIQDFLVGVAYKLSTCFTVRATQYLK